MTRRARVYSILKRNLRGDDRIDTELARCVGLPRGDVAFNGIVKVAESGSAELARVVINDVEDDGLSRRSNAHLRELYANDRSPSQSQGEEDEARDGEEATCEEASADAAEEDQDGNSNGAPEASFRQSLRPGERRRSRFVDRRCTERATANARGAGDADADWT